MKINGTVFHPCSAEGTHAYTVTLVRWERTYTSQPALFRTYHGTLTPQRGAALAQTKEAVISYALGEAGWAASTAHVLVLTVERNRVLRRRWNPWHWNAHPNAGS